MKNTILFIICSAPLLLVAKLQTDLYGYAKLDVEYNDRDTGSAPSPGPLSVPLKNNLTRQHGELILDARESRIGIKAMDTYKKAKIQGVIEGDFFTNSGDAINSNSRGFRLRQAYGKIEWPSSFFIMAGQSWSCFMNSVMGLPNTVDFNGPVGVISARQPQLRMGYVHTFKEKKSYLIFQTSLEKQAVEGIETAVNTAQGAGEKYPLFVGKIAYYLKRFRCEVAGALTQNRVTIPGGNQLTDKGWGVQGTGQFNLGHLTLFAHGQHLDGLGRMDGGNLPSVVITERTLFSFPPQINYTMHTVVSNGIYGGASWNFTKKTMMTGVYGWESAEKSSLHFVDPTLYYKFYSIHANVLHELWKRWQVGLEFERLAVTALSGEKGFVNIIHGGIWFFY